MVSFYVYAQFKNILEYKICQPFPALIMYSETRL